MVLGPKAGGVFGVLFGVAALAYSWYTIRTEGIVYPTFAAIGLAVLPVSFALAVLPTRQLMIPTETGDGRAVYDRQNPKWTPLGFGLLALGILAGVGLFLYLKTGL